MGRIKAICISPKRGTVKNAVSLAKMLPDFGLEDDAHAGTWHRQISLLANEAVRKFSDAYALDLSAGAFGENLLIEGIDLKCLPIGTKLKCATEILLEVTQIGKTCHLGCDIQKRTGKCIMPSEGIFARVLCGGTIQTGDSITVLSR
ncbi:MOSC domain-containing protein [Pectinatus haikarae]|uniref:MOSC domain-containing protein n=1 Tax=Pectinatus haikarae TaxID=349096 RepID=UPI0018C81FF6|nr:MOSC domain-containing protein [Pectinatus haikarae]